MKTHVFVAGAIVWLALCPAPGLADATLLYHSDVKVNPDLPPQVAQAMANQMTAAMPERTSMQFRNGKEFYSSGVRDSLTDFHKKEVTLIDRQTKRYVTVPFDSFGEELRKMMPQNLPASPELLTHFESRPTKRTATIQGIEGEEHESVLTISLAPSASGPAAAPASPFMRMVMHIWMPKASEVARIPALREISRYDLLADTPTSPLASLQTMAKQFPGIMEGIMGFIKELRASGSAVVLRMDTDMSMPLLIAQLKQRGGPDTPKFDAETPLMSVNYILRSVSTESLDDSLFQVPDGYQSSTLADMLKDRTQHAPPSPAPNPQPNPAP